MRLCVYHVFLICRERLEWLAASLSHICLSDIVQSSCCSAKMLHLVCIYEMKKKKKKQKISSLQGKTYEIANGEAEGLIFNI